MGGWMGTMEQVLIIGAGPCGLAAAVELKRQGIDPLVIEKGTLVNSIYRYPTYMIFHSTPELPRSETFRFRRRTKSRHGWKLFNTTVWWQPAISCGSTAMRRSFM